MASRDPNAKLSHDYIDKLIAEQKALSSEFSNASRLLKEEINRARNPDANDSGRKDSHIEIHKPKQFRLRVKVHIPIEENPQFNYVGKLLGPKGSSLQQLQEATQCKMAILGRGSMRDKKKEEELRKQGDPKYSHLNEDLHVEISAYAPPPEAYRRMSAAIAELAPFLVADFVPEYHDEMRAPPQYDNHQKPHPYGGPEPHMGHPRGGPPPRQMGGPPMMPARGEREPPPAARRNPMVQSTYVAPEPEEWNRPSPRRGGGGGDYNPPPSSRPVAPPQRSSGRSYEEPPNDYNNYGGGDSYGDYNSGNSSYYDYPPEPEPNYADGYNDDVRGPPVRSGGATQNRGGSRNNARMQSHPYSGAQRRGY